MDPRHDFGGGGVKICGNFVADAVVFEGHSRERFVFHHRHLAARGDLADLLLRSSGIGCSGDYVPVAREQCFEASAWNLLLAGVPETEQPLTKAAIARTLEQIPAMLDGMV